jgi:hypothetical protein
VITDHVFHGLSESEAVFRPSNGSMEGCYKAVTCLLFVLTNLNNFEENASAPFTISVYSDDSDCFLGILSALTDDCYKLLLSPVLSKVWNIIFMMQKKHNVSVGSVLLQLSLGSPTISILPAHLNGQLKHQVNTFIAYNFLYSNKFGPSSALLTKHPDYVVNAIEQVIKSIHAASLVKAVSDDSYAANHILSDDNSENSLRQEALHMMYTVILLRANNLPLGHYLYKYAPPHFENPCNIDEAIFNNPTQFRISSDKIWPGSLGLILCVYRAQKALLRLRYSCQLAENMTVIEMPSSKWNTVDMVIRKWTPKAIEAGEEAGGKRTKRCPLFYQASNTPRKWYVFAQVVW